MEDDVRPEFMNVIAMCLVPQFQREKKENARERRRKKKKEQEQEQNMNKNVFPKRNYIFRYHNFKGM